MQEAGHRLPVACGRDFWELAAPFCPEGGQEIGIIPCEAHRAQDKAEAVFHLEGRMGILGNVAILGNQVSALPLPKMDGIM